MKKIRILAFLLSFCLMISLLVSCEEVTETTETETTESIVESYERETSEAKTVTEWLDTQPVAPELEIKDTEANIEIEPPIDFVVETEKVFFDPNDIFENEANQEATDISTTATENESTKEIENENRYEDDVITTTCNYVDEEFTEDVNHIGLKFTSNGDGTCFVSGLGICNESEIVIPSVSPDNEKVVGIGFSSFYGRSDITSVIIPEGVTTISPFAFDKCVNLTSISIPDSIEEIGQYAFRDCNLEYSTLLNCYYLGNENNKYLVLVDVIDKESPYFSINSGTRVILYRSFIGYSHVKDIYIPEGVVSIGREAFSNCDNVETLTLPSTIKYLGMEVFDNCSALERVNYKGKIADWEYVTMEDDPFWQVILVLGYGTGDELWLEYVPMEE